MIDNLFFILQIIGVVILIGWAVVHDKLAEGAASRGPLAFRQAGRGKAWRTADSRRRKAGASLDMHRDEAFGREDA
ncbi:MAG: hypothetical protein R3F54_07840 [Alphaproteobacteria bacterium]